MASAMFISRAVGNGNVVRRKYRAMKKWMEESFLGVMTVLPLHNLSHH